LAELICHVGELATVETAIEQLDLNPVFVYPAGQGVMVVDALVSGAVRTAEYGH
jgi:acetyltransferase